MTKRFFVGVAAAGMLVALSANAIAQQLPTRDQTLDPDPNMQTRPHVDPNTINQLNPGAQGNGGAAAQSAPAQSAPSQTAPMQTAPLQTAPLQTAPMQTAPTVGGGDPATKKNNDATTPPPNK